MKNTSIYNDLIRAIEKLYSSVTLQILQKRMDSYHSLPSTDAYTERALDIKDPLFKYIDNVSQTAPKPAAEAQPLEDSVSSQASQPHSPVQSEFASQRPVPGKTVSGLTKYFSATHNETEFHPGIAEKLQHSFWEHIHTAIRQARLGNARVAKIHADIANNAYKELTHYVSSETHAKFALELEEHLGELLNNK